ncbi:MAG: glutaredoxin [Alteromonadaceae bacterium]|nr:MAG: glutaredoxin [Alteromonadaceae bacterium]
MLLKLLREGLGRLIVFINWLTRPSPMQRSSDKQEHAEIATKGLSLYQFYACPFCVKTRRAIHRLNLPITYRNAQQNPHREELELEGGRIKVPCLRIEEEGAVRWLYESNDIIKYLDSRFA